MIEKQKEKIAEHCSSLRIDRKIKYLIFEFMLIYPFTDKKISLFLKMSKHNEKLGFINRYFIRAAYEYKVPTVYIKQYVDNKNSNNYNKLYDKNTQERIKRMTDLHRKSILFYKAVLEQMKRHNSRQEKLFKVIERISENKN